MTNETIYVEFERIALQLIAEGRKTWSSDALLHIIRFNTRLHGDDPMFRINNNLSAVFSRRFIHDHPEHGEFFHLRKSKHDKPFIFDETGQSDFLSYKQ